MTTDLGEYGTGEEPTYRSPGRRPRRLTRRHLVAVPLVLLLVEAVVLAGRLQTQHHRDADPVRVATDFFSAVANDDAVTAGALTRLPAGIDTRFAPEDLRAQGGITLPTVTGSSRHDDRATVTVTYTLAGLPARSDLVLARTYDGFVRAPTWRIVGGLPVLHIRAAAFEREATVDGREILLRHGAADVTVLPGLVTISLPAIVDAAAAATTISATADGSVVRLPATLDPTLADELQGTISGAVVDKYPGAQVGGTAHQHFDFQIGDDATVSFQGQVPLDAGFDNQTGELMSPSHFVSVSGTATFGGGGLSLTALQIG